MRTSWRVPNSSMRRLVDMKRENEKIQRLLACTRKRMEGRPVLCPSCGSPGSKHMSSKWAVAQLRECMRCRLMFRWPTEPVEESFDFYQEKYKQGFTTDCPDERALAQLLETRFRGTEKDFSVYMDVLRALGCVSGRG